MHHGANVNSAERSRKPDDPLNKLKPLEVLKLQTQMQMFLETIQRIPSLYSILESVCNGNVGLLINYLSSQQYQQILVIILETINRYLPQVAVTSPSRLTEVQLQRLQVIIKDTIQKDLSSLKSQILDSSDSVNKYSIKLLSSRTNQQVQSQELLNTLQTPKQSSFAAIKREMQNQPQRSQQSVSASQFQQEMVPTSRFQGDETKLRSAIKVEQNLKVDRHSDYGTPKDQLRQKPASQEPNLESILRGVNKNESILETPNNRNGLFNSVVGAQLRASGPLPEASLSAKQAARLEVLRGEVRKSQPMQKSTAATISSASFQEFVTQQSQAPRQEMLRGGFRSPEQQISPQIMPSAPIYLADGGNFQLEWKPDQEARKGQIGPATPIYISDGGYQQQEWRPEQTEWKPEQLRGGVRPEPRNLESSIALSKAQFETSRVKEPQHKKLQKSVSEYHPNSDGFPLQKKDSKKEQNASHQSERKIQEGNHQQVEFIGHSLQSTESLPRSSGISQGTPSPLRLKKYKSVSKVQWCKQTKHEHDHSCRFQEMNKELLSIDYIKRKGKLKQPQTDHQRDFNIITNSQVE